MFQPQDEEMQFTVGDNTTISDNFGNNCWNRPLTPGVQYQVTLLAINCQDGECRYSFAKLQHPVKTLSASHAEEEGGTGAEWAALLLLLIIPAIVYLFIRSVVYRYRDIHYAYSSFCSVVDCRFSFLYKQSHFSYHCHMQYGAEIHPAFFILGTWIF
jgi:hypothetical protein